MTQTTSVSFTTASNVVTKKLCAFNFQYIINLLFINYSFSIISSYLAGQDNHLVTIFTITEFIATAIGAYSHRLIVGNTSLSTYVNAAQAKAISIHLPIFFQSIAFKLNLSDIF
jgi:hypothetical protein